MHGVLGVLNIVAATLLFMMKKVAAAIYAALLLASLAQALLFGADIAPSDTGVTMFAVVLQGIFTLYVVRLWTRGELT